MENTKTNASDEEMQISETVINRLIGLEWDFFQKTRNITGRASCQDNYDMFYAMRRSQWASLWPDVVRSCLQDDLDAKNTGRNPVAEKYGYMMMTDAPAEYEKIRSLLPAVSQEKAVLVEKIVSVFLRWYEELIPVLPLFMKHGRNLHTSSDSIYGVSVETYLRGELKTYSEATLQLWLKLAEEEKTAGLNRVKKIYDATAGFYGYASAEELEQSLRLSGQPH